MNAGLKVSIGGQNLGKALVDGAKGAVIAAAGGAAANEIGLLYDEKDINFLEHKGLHGVLGAVMGFASTGKLEDGLAGFGTAIAAETFMEKMAERLSDESLNLSFEEYQQHLDTCREITRVAVGGAALFAGADVNVMDQIATNAIDNNYRLFVMIGAWVGAHLDKIKKLTNVLSKLKPGQVAKNAGKVAKKEAVEVAKLAEKAAEEGVEKAAKKAADVIVKNKGRSGKQQQLRKLAKDDKLGRANRGWIRQEINEVARGKKTYMRNPPGKDLAHKRGYEASKGFDYRHTQLQDRDLHRLQHKYDLNGAKNKTPLKPNAQQ